MYSSGDNENSTTTICPCFICFILVSCVTAIFTRFLFGWSAARSTNTYRGIKFHTRRVCLFFSNRRYCFRMTKWDSEVLPVKWNPCWREDSTMAAHQRTWVIYCCRVFLTRLFEEKKWFFVVGWQQFFPWSLSRNVRWFFNHCWQWQIKRRTTNTTLDIFNRYIQSYFGDYKYITFWSHSIQ